MNTQYAPHPRRGKWTFNPTKPKPAKKTKQNKPHRTTRTKNRRTQKTQTQHVSNRINMILAPPRFFSTRNGTEKPITDLYQTMKTRHMGYQKYIGLRHIKLKSAKKPNLPKSANLTIRKRDTTNQQTFDTHDYPKILAAFGLSETTLVHKDRKRTTLPLYKALKIFKETESTTRMHIKITGTHAMTDQARLIRTLEKTGTLARQHLRNPPPKTCSRSYKPP
jgi:hypothetical protein